MHPLRDYQIEIIQRIEDSIADRCLKNSRTFIFLNLKSSDEIGTYLLSTELWLSTGYLNNITKIVLPVIDQTRLEFSELSS